VPIFLVEGTVYTALGLQEPSSRTGAFPWKVGALTFPPRSLSISLSFCIFLAQTSPSLPGLHHS